MAFTSEDFGAWSEFLAPLESQAWYHALQSRVEAAYQSGTPQVFPPRENLFRALRETSPERVKCIIIGQDPYHGAGQAHGLSFSVERGVAVPPSLKNIYKELQADLGMEPPKHGCLAGWSEQGVLLLNSVLTVYEGDANSHKNWGWEKFTDCVIGAAEQLPQPIAYILWGKSAQDKAKRCGIGSGEHDRLILRSNHPSPLSAYRGFFGSRPFSQVNTFLLTHNETPINWQLT